jgi:hypothetical protein
MHPFFTHRYHAYGTSTFPQRRGTSAEYEETFQEALSNWTRVYASANAQTSTFISDNGLGKIVLDPTDDQSSLVCYQYNNGYEWSNYEVSFTARGDWLMPSNCKIIFMAHCSGYGWQTGNYDGYGFEYISGYFPNKAFHPMNLAVDNAPDFIIADGDIIKYTIRSVDDVLTMKLYANGNLLVTGIDEGDLSPIQTVGSIGLYIRNDADGGLSEFYIDNLQVKSFN